MNHLREWLGDEQRFFGSRKRVPFLAWPSRLLGRRWRQAPTAARSQGVQPPVCAGHHPSHVASLKWARKLTTVLPRRYNHSRKVKRASHLHESRGVLPGAGASQEAAESGEWLLGRFVLSQRLVGDFP